MTSDPEFERLVSAVEAYTMEGWDWSALEGRYTEADPPWNYRAAVTAQLPAAHTLLDMGTGGGEFLSSLAPLPPECWATEAYLPNVPVATARLEPLGVRVVAVEEDARLPLPDAHFDLVINRHESFDPDEVRRILKPGGRFITQQVGGQDNVELNLALQETVALSYGTWDAGTAARQLRDAGLEVLEEREAFSPGHFADIGAVVMYLRIAPWQIDGFDLAAYRERLLALHHRMQTDGGLATRIHRFFVVARRPAG
ncbi:MAG: class I SAM-dependent methyltransferase [Chloroflexi bacterium OHK40]